MSYAKVALVTTAPARAKDEDLAPLFAALQAEHVLTYIVDWDDATVDWSQFDAAILRSPWDYMDRFDEFSRWAERAAQQTRLLNPLSLVQWNLDKHYLLDLERAGLPVVPSKFLEPTAAISALPVFEGFTQTVVKPAIGAGSRDARRFLHTQHAEALAHARQLLNQNRSVLLQPYLNRVDQAGETALMFFNGDYSHAIRKGPLLRLNEGATSKLFAPEAITARTPDAAEMQLAQAVIEWMRREKDGAPLYARVDLIRANDGSPCILELELTEPSLFFLYDTAAAGRFAKVVVEAVRAQ